MRLFFECFFLCSVDNNAFGQGTTAFANIVDALAENSTLQTFSFSNNHVNDSAAFAKLAATCRVPTLIMTNNRTMVATHTDLVVAAIHFCLPATFDLPA